MLGEVLNVKHFNSYFTLGEVLNVKHFNSYFILALWANWCIDNPLSDYLKWRYVWQRRKFTLSHSVQCQFWQSEDWIWKINCFAFFSDPADVLNNPTEPERHHNRRLGLGQVHVSERSCPGSQPPQLPAVCARPLQGRADHGPGLGLSDQTQAAGWLLYWPGVVYSHCCETRLMFVW